MALNAESPVAHVHTPSQDRSDRLHLPTTNVDKLTGMPHAAVDLEGRSLKDSILKEMAKLLHEGYKIVSLSTDIDNLKKINSIYPRKTADRGILTLFEELRKKITDKPELICFFSREHAGGDDFDGLIFTKDDPKKLAAELQLVLSQSVPYTAPDKKGHLRTLELTASIGVSSFTLDTDVKELYENTIHRIDKTVTANEIRRIAILKQMHLIFAGIEETKTPFELIGEDEVSAMDINTYPKLDVIPTAQLDNESGETQKLVIEKIVYNSVFGPILRNLEEETAKNLDAIKSAKIEKELQDALEQVDNIKTLDELIAVYKEILQGRRLDDHLLDILLKSFVEQVLRLGKRTLLGGIRTKLSQLMHGMQQ